MAFNWKDNEYPRSLFLRIHDGVNPDIEANDITATGIVNVNELIVNGNIQIQDTTTIDLISGLEYDYADPLIVLNSSSTGAPLYDAGLIIERGAGNDSAYLRYSDAAGGAPGQWYAGIGAAVTPMLVLNSGVSHEMLLYWDVSTGKANGSPNFRLASGVFTTSLSIDSRLGLGEFYTLTRDDYLTPVGIFGHRTAGVIDNKSYIGFQNVTPHNIPYTNVPSHSFQGRGYIHVDTPTDALRLILDDTITLSRTLNEAKIATQGTTLVLDSPTNIDLDVGTVVNISNDLYIGGNLNVNLEVSVAELTSERRSWTIPSGFNPIPNPWTGVSQISYAAYGTTLTTNIVSSSRINEISYVLTISWTIQSGGGQEVPSGMPYHVITPVNGYNNLEDIWVSKAKLLRKNTVGGAYVLNQPIALENIKIIAPYAIPPANPTMTGYHVLEVRNIVGAVGYYEAVICLEVVQ